MVQCMLAGAVLVGWAFLVVLLKPWEDLPRARIDRREQVELLLFLISSGLAVGQVASCVADMNGPEFGLWGDRWQLALSMFELLGILLCLLIMRGRLVRVVLSVMVSLAVLSLAVTAGVADVVDRVRNPTQLTYVDGDPPDKPSAGLHPSANHDWRLEPGGAVASRLEIDAPRPGATSFRVQLLPDCDASCVVKTCEPTASWRVTVDGQPVDAGAALRFGDYPGFHITDGAGTLSFAASRLDREECVVRIRLILEYL
jgi:hypothetical protein